MASYFRKMMAFATPPSSTRSGSASSDCSSTTSLPYSYSTIPVQSQMPPPPQVYFYASKTPKGTSCDRDASPKAMSTHGWNEKQGFQYDTTKDVGHCGFQYPAKADRSVYSQTGSANSSVSSFGTVSSSSSSSSLTSVYSSPKNKKPSSSALKGSPNSSPKLSVKSKCRVSFTNPSKAQPVHMHPLFAINRSRPAPIQYDVSSAPTTINILDFTNKRIPLCTLLESATEPPTRGKLTVTSDEFPWPIVVHASGNSTPVDAAGRPIRSAVDAGSSTKASDPGYYPHSTSPSSGSLSSKLTSPGSGKASSNSSSGKRSSSPRNTRKFFIDASDSDDDQDPDSSPSDAVVSNLDVLCAIHSTLSRAICQDEWDGLGDGDTVEQRRIARAYRRRCRETGGNLAEGVKRIDFLKSRTVLVGIESRRDGDPRSGREGVVGKLVFAEER